MQIQQQIDCRDDTELQFSEVPPVILLHGKHKCFTSSRVKVLSKQMDLEVKRNRLFSRFSLKNAVSILPSLK